MSSRRTNLPFLAGLLLAVAFDAAATSSLVKWTGGKMPALKLVDVDGRERSISEWRGKTVVVNFWATWCEPCRDEMPALARLREQLKDRPFEVLAVNYGESNAKVAGFLEREKLALPVLLDGDKAASERWGAKGLPMTFLVDARGRVRYRVFGERDWTEGEALQVVEKLIGEAPVARR
jgi:thiol-disulfide isomerase/thioredoxin